MIFLCAGVYAEGPTDDRFLCTLLDRFLPLLAHEICRSPVEMGDSRRIDEPRAMRRASREERIAAAIERSWGECTLFVVHGDGAGTPDLARERQVEPGLSRARLLHPGLAAAGCVPVRETEAWMLADEDAFRRAFEIERAPELPRDPEAELDPKKTLEKTIRDLGAPMRRRGAQDYYALLGAEVDPEALRRLPAFRRFEADLRAAIAQLDGSSSGGA